MADIDCIGLIIVVAIAHAHLFLDTGDSLRIELERLSGMMLFDWHLKNTPTECTISVATTVIPMWPWHST